MGYRRIRALLGREGMTINAKRVQRVRRAEGLQVSRKQRRMKRLGLSTAQRQRATENNAVWSWDFVEDQTENGSRFRMLTLLDEHSRRCLAVHGSPACRPPLFPSASSVVRGEQMGRELRSSSPASPSARKRASHL